ncbi:MAG: hypothetical protein IPK60_13055 [Sandaracinaceae bacterium]|jgi:hypothetical protein|nr:hypothetical protein [Sandaracinaceae bacterium]
MTRSALLSAFVLFTVAITSHLAAQDEPGPVAPPTYSGGTRVTGAVSRATGAIYELSNGARFVVPAGLPVGTSRILNFGTATGFRAADVDPHFTRQGGTFAFDGAIDATRAPVEFSIRARGFRLPPRTRLVLAVEVGGICDARHTRRISQVLCSTWQVIDAQYDENAGRILATIPSPGGFRLQFGLLPQTETPPPQL